MEPIIVKILYGLIASSVLGMFVTVMARTIEKKATKDMPVSKAVGTLLFLLIVAIWYIGLIWYWITLLGEATVG